MSRLLHAALVALLLALVAGVTHPAPAAAFDRVVNETTLFRLVNHARVQQGLRPLLFAEPLRRAALSHSRDMLAHDYFGHSSLAGAGIGARARRAGYASGGLSSVTVGEVIAWGKSYRGSPQSVFRNWMRSGIHRHVILSSRWRDVGIGCVRGTYRGICGAIMYTVDFGRRAQ